MSSPLAVSPLLVPNLLYTPNPWPNYLYFVHIDMGCGEEDGSIFFLNSIQPDSFNTTHMILKEMDRGRVDFILHLGDISYARGFSSVVSYYSCIARILPSS